MSNTTAKGYLVVGIKGYAYDENGKPIEADITGEKLEGFTEQFKDTPITSVILEDFESDNTFEVGLCSMATLIDGSKKELSHSYSINGVPHNISFIILLVDNDRTRIENLMMSNTWKLPATFNPDESGSIFF